MGQGAEGTDITDIPGTPEIAESPGTCGGADKSHAHGRLFLTPRRTLCSPPSGFLPARYLALASGKPITGCRWYFRVTTCYTGLTPCALLCRPYGAVAGKGSPLVKSRSDEARCGAARIAYRYDEVHRINTRGGYFVGLYMALFLYRL